MIIHGVNNEYGALSEESKEWYKLVIKNIIKYCEGAVNYNIIHVDKGGETIYGISSRTSPNHARFYQWLRQMYKAGVTYEDDRVLTPLAVFYFNEYASARPLLRTAIESRDYSIVWILLNFYIWGFKTGDVIKYTQDIINKCINVLENNVKLGDYLTCRKVLYKLLFTDYKINRAFKFRLLYQLLSNIKQVDVYTSARKYGAISNGMQARFYRNFIPLIYELFGDEGIYKLTAGVKSALNNFNKFKQIQESMED